MNKEKDEVLLESKKNTTNGFEWLYAYWCDIKKMDSFQNIAKKLRKKYKIPLTGYTKKENYHYPILPDGWQHKETLKSLDNLIKDIDKLCKKYYLYNQCWKEILWDFIIYNHTDSDLHHWLYDYDLCRLDDLLMQKKYTYPSDKTLKRLEQKIDHDIDLEFPIAIRISPYASINDIKNFLQKKEKIIKLYQSHYRKKDTLIHHIRPKNEKISERDEFIIQKRGRPYKKISEMLNLISEGKGWPPVDIGGIGKIISLSKKYDKK